jgi:hypothetical protein
MARKTVTITIDDEGRDKDKVFVLTEMSSEQAEAWAIRALAGLAKAGVNIPEDWRNMAIPVIASMTLQAFAGIPFFEAEPLLAEMMGCVKIQPSPNVVRDLIDDDIEEVMTRLRLKKDVFELNFGFFASAVRSILTSATRRAGGSKSTKTSLQPAAR